MCEQYLMLSEEQVVLLIRAAEAESAGDQDLVDEVTDAIEANTAERRLLLLRIYEMAHAL